MNINFRSYGFRVVNLCGVCKVRGEHYTSAAQISGDSREEQSRSPLYERINWTQETENCAAFYGVLCCVPRPLHFTLQQLDLTVLHFTNKGRMQEHFFFPIFYEI